MKFTRFAVALSGLMVSAFSIQAGTVYLDDNLGQLWAGDPTTGVYSYVGVSSVAAGFGGFTDIDFVGNVLYGLSPTGELYAINSSNGQISADIGSTGVGNGSLVGLAGSPSGALWAGGNNAVYTLNTSTGASTLVGGGGNYTTEGDMDFVGNGNLYLTSTTPSGGALFLIDQSTGAGTFQGQLMDGNGNNFTDVFGVAYDTDNGIFYGYDVSGNQFDINTANPNSSGTGEEIFTESGGIADKGGILGAAFQSTPEPSTFALIGLGLVAFALVRRRKAAPTV